MLGFKEFIEMRLNIGTPADCAEVPESETAPEALLSQASNSFSDAVRSSVSLTGLRRYSVLQRDDSVRV